MGAKMSEPKRIKISDLTPDPHNANAGSKRGLELLEHSLSQYGAGRSILLDKQGRVIAGNKTLEEWQAMGFDEVLVIPSDGSVLVAVQRDDLDLLEDAKARMLAYADNRVAEIDLSWNPEQLATDITNGLPLEDVFFDWELDRLLNIGEELDYDKAWEGMPEFEQEDITAFHSIKVHFNTPEDIEAFAALLGQTVTDKTQYIYYPKQERENLKQYQVVSDEP